jgi:hypothetical protein
MDNEIMYNDIIMEQLSYQLAIVYNPNPGQELDVIELRRSAV